MNGGLIMFFGDSRIRVLKESIQKKEHNHHCSVFKVLR